MFPIGTRVLLSMQQVGDVNPMDHIPDEHRGTQVVVGHAIEHQVHFHFDEQTRTWKFVDAAGDLTVLHLLKPFHRIAYGETWMAHADNLVEFTPGPDRAWVESTRALFQQDQQKE